MASLLPNAAKRAPVIAAGAGAAIVSYFPSAVANPIQRVRRAVSFCRTRPLGRSAFSGKKKGLGRVPQAGKTDMGLPMKEPWARGYLEIEMPKKDSKGLAPLTQPFLRVENISLDSLRIAAAILGYLALAIFAEYLWLYF